MKEFTKQEKEIQIEEAVKKHPDELTGAVPVVINYEKTNYIISPQAYCYNLKTGNFLKPIKNGAAGYFQFHLYHNGKAHKKLCHRLVAKYFLPLPKSNDKLEIDHINNCKQDNRVENLQYLTHADNWIKSNAKLSEAEVKKIKENISETMRELAVKYNVSYSTIYKIKNNNSWRHI